jgi:dihydropteroate synthase
MGICNVTADSFSDGGAYLEPGAGLAHARAMVRQGADMVDVGAESTRPGAARVDADTETQRVLSVLPELAGSGVAVSVDTMRATVALAAIEAGAFMINDVSGGLADPQMLPAIARTDALYVIGHWRGHSRVMDQLADYADVVADVSRELQVRAKAATAAGIDPGRIVLDPGLGFSKNTENNWVLLRHLDVLAALGFPLLIGASRKRFLEPLSPGAKPQERDGATAAITALVAVEGVWAVRVHEIAGNLAAAQVAAAWRAIPE